MSTALAEKVYVGMGATPHEAGVAFRVWAPHADAVYVMGSFNDWSSDAHPMVKEGDGYWYADIPSAAVGAEYRYRILSGDKELVRIDPYARQVTSSVGNAVIYDPHFDWEGDDFHLPAVNELVIYEMHLGTFHDKEDGKSDKFEEAVQKLDHLQRLGVNVMEVMPLAQFAGELSWGYNPSCVFAVETNYGGPAGFKRFVKAVHRAGLRSLDSVRGAIEGRFNGDPFQRVIYSESHDEVANGKARVASEIDPHDPDSWFAQKRTTLAAALVLTAPGIPMLFQGQEFLEDGWFQDSVPLDWHKSEEFSGLVRMYRDLIRLRLNRSGSTRGLSGSGLNTFHQNQADDVIAYHRWHQGGPGDDVVVVVNLSHLAHENYKLGFPSPGTWRLRLNSDWTGYSRAFGNQACSDVVAAAERSDQPQDANAPGQDGFPAGGTINIGPYSVLVFSQDPVVNQ